MMEFYVFCVIKRFLISKKLFYLLGKFFYGN